MNIGKAMRRIREERSIPRSALAKSLGITASALWKIENGKAAPRQKVIDKFCAEIKIPVAYLYDQAKTTEDYLIPS